MREFLKVYAPISLLIIASFVLTYQFAPPTPPHHLRIAAGATGGAYAAFARRYQAALARDGITLDIVYTVGSLQNLALLNLPQGGVDLAFVQGGTGSPKQMPELRSIASLYYEPLWVFTRGAPPATLSGLRGKRIAIGVEGSGTRALALQLLDASGIDAGATTLVALDAVVGAAALKAGRIDALFQVSARRASVIDDLMLSPGINLMSFEQQAQAYAHRFRFLSVVTLWRGLISLDRDIPPRDVTLLAPATALVARAGLHPALIDLLVATAVDIQGPGYEFEQPGEFPSAHHLDFPLSNEARRALQYGPTFLRRYLPFWAAVLVERLWIMVLPLLTLVIPLLRVAPPTYRRRVISQAVACQA